MAPETAIVPKRTRESTSKVRTGCSTCKARRVKCDEAKPMCRRCAIGGRQCAYTTQQTALPRRRDVITVYLPPAQGQPAFFVNSHALDFFHQNLAATLDGQFDSRFWTTLVPQLAHAEPSIRHAVSAITIIYQDVQLSLRDTSGYVQANPEGQREWSTAVRSLSSRIETDPSSNLVPLVCCLLFTCIEFLWGHTESAMLHVQSGFKILAMLGDAPNSKSTHRLSDSDQKAIGAHIVPVFSRLNVLCSLAGRINPSMHLLSAETDSPPNDLGDARRQLVDISNICIRFIDTATRKAVVYHQITNADLAKQAELETRLDTWRDQLTDLVERIRASGKTVKQKAINMLLVQYKVIYIWMRVCTTVSETVTDLYHKDFEELVEYAEQVITPQLIPQPLSFDLQILGPLYYAALKCRHPTIRRRALDMLQWSPRREGFWNAHHAYATARRVIETEERYLAVSDGSELPDETVRIHGLPLPDDDSRILHPSKFSYGIVPSPVYPGTVEVVFQTKPWGLLGDWHATTEYIKL